MTECRVCSLVPRYHYGKYNKALSTVELVDSSTYVDILVGKDENNRVVIYGISNDYSNPYYPKYCPECGRKLQ